MDNQPGRSPADLGYGIGFGHSKESAQIAALAKCNSIGNGTCRVVGWFEKCGAYAISNEKYGIGWADSVEDAKGKALAQCGSDLCRIVASGCGD